MIVKNFEYEEIAQFLEDPTRVNFRELIKKNKGESNNLDFKREWIDKEKLVRHILAFSNSGGGVIVFGVAEEKGQLTPVGLEELKDQAEVGESVKPYLPVGIEYKIDQYKFEESEYQKIKGKQYQVMRIGYNPSGIPFLCAKKGKKLEDNVAYIRRQTGSVIANHEELQRLFDERREPAYITENILELKEHLDQLKTLYSYSPKNFSTFVADLPFIRGLTNLASTPNPNHPKKSYHEFIGDIIKKKQLRIESFLEID